MGKVKQHMENLRKKNKGLRNMAYICQKMSFIGGILWLINILLFFVECFSGGTRLHSVKLLLEGYGGALIAAIVPILMLYFMGGVIYLLLDIEANTRKTQ
jgi:uncharacterized membrane protein